MYAGTRSGHADSSVAAPQAAGAPPAGGGALVVSLDFELAWGVFDSLGADGAYRANLLGAREVVPRMLELFAAYEVGATWATVGFLFASGREELEAFSPGPDLRPTYADPRRDPYRQRVGESERDDPLRFAPSLLRLIATTPRQEVASHTFSHYYSLEPGQTREQFRADLDAAMAIARAKGHTLRSLVVPRHQVRADYFEAIAAAGFEVHRSHERNALTVPGATGSDPRYRRALRLLDSYLPLTGHGGVPWASTAPDAHGLVDVRESRFLRPAIARLAPAEPLRQRRVLRAMERAARRGELFHLWWHPHNFGADLELNLANLRRVLEGYRRLRDAGLMRSLTMAEVGAAVRAAAPDRAHRPEAVA